MKPGPTFRGATSSGGISIIERLISGLMTIPGVLTYGITDPFGFDQHVPTVTFTLEGYAPRQAAGRLGDDGIFVRD